MATRPEEPRPGPEAAVRPPDPPPETVPARNLRVLRADVLPRVVVALRPPALGDGGEVTVESADAYDTRAECSVALRHAAPDGPGYTSRLRLVHDTRERWTRVFFDLFGDGKYRRIDPSRPIILWRNPLTGKETDLRSEPLARAVAAFDGLPRDDRTEAEFAAHLRRLDDATAPYLGNWYDRGNPAVRIEVRRGRGDEGGGPLIEFVAASGKRSAFGYTWMRFDAGGRVCNLTAFDLGVARLSPDGRRIDFPQTGHWWTREPSAVH